MNNMLKQIVNLKTSLWVNAFIYYFKRLFIIGKCMPDSMYSNYSLKKALSVAAVVLRQIFDFFGKPLYLLSFVSLPIILITKSNPELKGQELAIMTNVLFFLNCIIGSFADNHIFAVSREKITLIKYMHMNARDYILSSLAFRYLPFFLYYLPCLIVAALFYGGTVWQGILLWLMLVSFRMMGEAFQLYIFDHTGKVMSRNMVYAWSIIIIGLTAAYVLPILGWSWLVNKILFHTIGMAFYLILGIGSLYYITVGYRYYEKKLPHSIDISYLLSTMMKASSSASFKQVEMKETEANLSETTKAQYTHLKGYSYINALFFARHKRQLNKSVYYRLLVVAIIFVVAVVLYITKQDLAVKLSLNMTASFLPFSVFFMYYMTIAEKACRAMFYNCDKDMLHYAYYRQPQTILKNFKVRLARISYLNAIIAFFICLVAVGFCIICGTNILTMDMLLFCVTVILLSVLFTTHHLCLYYIFQPYSESLQVKNPFFTIINSIMSFLCFLCLQIEVGGPLFTVVVLSFTIMYIVGALILVYYHAPKSFRIK